VERFTRQRQAVQEVLLEQGRPLLPQEVLEAAQAKVPGIGIATVYRTLKGLVETGGVVPVTLPGEAARYELAGKKHHHHFCCTQCNKVFELEGCLPNVAGLAPAGFQTDSHEIVLYGKCTVCLASGLA
jgi:Fur family transcriptional regulator, ferric uptake regulator